MPLKIVERYEKARTSGGDYNVSENKAYELLRKTFPDCEISRQPPTFEFFPKFKKSPANTYTADFYLEYKGYPLYLEYKPPGNVQVYRRKGASNLIRSELDTFKYKVIAHHLWENGCLFEIITFYPNDSNIYIHSSGYKKTAYSVPLKEYIDEYIGKIEEQKQLVKPL